MKRNDLIAVILVATIGVVVAMMVTNIMMGDPDLHTESFKVVKVVNNKLDVPDPEVFNNDAINPTVEVKVGDCVDLDQNGILDTAELKACGRTTE